MFRSALTFCKTALKPYANITPTAEFAFKHVTVYHPKNGGHPVFDTPNMRSPNTRNPYSVLVRQSRIDTDDTCHKYELICLDGRVVSQNVVAKHNAPSTVLDNTFPHTNTCKWIADVKNVDIAHTDGSLETHYHGAGYASRRWPGGTSILGDAKNWRFHGNISRSYLNGIVFDGHIYSDGAVRPALWLSRVMLRDGTLVFGRYSCGYDTGDITFSEKSYACVKRPDQQPPVYQAGYLIDGQWILDSNVTAKDAEREYGWFVFSWKQM